MRQRNRQELIDLLLKLGMIMLFTVGALIFSYPFISDSINNYYDQKMMNSQLKSTNETVKLENEIRLKEWELKNQQMLDEKYSKNIPGLGLVEDPFSDSVGQGEVPGESYYREHLLGAIYIPKIKVSLPVFDETNNTLLEKGATLLQGTSYPIGGIDTHSVITSHSGLPEKKLFTDLERLEVGDLFYVEVGSEMLAYEVYQLSVVLPHEIDAVTIQEGLDQVTLLTCTPYMINTHRLLVSGKRVDFVAEEVNEQIEEVVQYHSQRVYWNISMLVGFLLLSGFLAYSRYRYYLITKKKFLLSFDLTERDVDEEFGLFSFLGNERLGIRARPNANGVLSFGEIPGGTYWIAPVDSKKMRFKIKAKIKKGRFVVYHGKK